MSLAHQLVSDELNTSLPSVPRALSALSALEQEVKTAPTFVSIDRIANEAAGLQRAFKPVKEVADRAGEVWIAAELRIGEELAKLPKAQGTKGQFSGKAAGTGKGQGKGKATVVSGGAKAEPPETNAPTLAELGVAKKRAARAKRIAAIPEEKRKQYSEELKSEDKAVTPDGVLRKQRAENKRDKKHAVATAVFSEDGPFNCVVIDPPWPVAKIDRDVRPNQDAFDYPTMTEPEIVDFWKRDVAGKITTDAHIFMWTTQKFLPAAIRMLDELGLRYVLTMVWHKAGGFQPVGLPQYNCEFIVYSRLGAPEFIETKDFFTCFEAQRREHSRKPDEFYDVLRRVTGGSRVDIFSRERRDGFAQFGNQPDHFEGAA